MQTQFSAAKRIAGGVIGSAIVGGAIFGAAGVAAASPGPTPEARPGHVQVFGPYDTAHRCQVNLDTVKGTYKIEPLREISGWPKAARFSDCYRAGGVWRFTLTAPKVTPNQPGEK